MVEARTAFLSFGSTLGLSHLTLDLELAQPHQRLAAALLALGGCAQPGGLFATLAGRRVALQFALELLDPLGHLLADRRQPALPPERGRPGRGADLDTVLRQAFQTDQAIIDQRRHAVGQQPIQHRLMIGAEVRKSMGVHPHAAAQPTIDEVAQRTISRALPTPSITAYSHSASSRRGSIGVRPTVCVHALIEA